MIVHRKDTKKQNTKLNKLISIENVFHKNLSQRAYQWGTQGIYIYIKLKVKLKKKTFTTNKFHKNYPKGRINGGTQGRP